MSLRPKIIWDYNSRPAKSDECTPLMQVELPDHTQFVLHFNHTESRLHIEHDGNWGYISYEQDSKAPPRK